MFSIYFEFANFPTLIDKVDKNYLGFSQNRMEYIFIQLCQGSDADIVKYFLDRHRMGARLQSSTRYRPSEPLFRALSKRLSFLTNEEERRKEELNIKYQEEQQLLILKLLFERGANINEPRLNFNSWKEESDALIIHTICSGQTRAVIYLLEQKPCGKKLKSRNKKVVVITKRIIETIYQMNNKELAKYLCQSRGIDLGGCIRFDEGLAQNTDPEMLNLLLYNRNLGSMINCPFGVGLSEEVKNYLDCKLAYIKYWAPGENYTWSSEKRNYLYQPLSLQVDEIKSKLEQHKNILTILPGIQFDFQHEVEKDEESLQLFSTKERLLGDERNKNMEMIITFFIHGLIDLSDQIGFENCWIKMIQDYVNLIKINLNNHFPSALSDIILKGI
jgi:hypothetical protein